MDKGKDIVLPWDFSFLHSLGRKTSFDTQDFAHTDILLGSDTTFYYTCIEISANTYARLAFHVQDMPETLHLTNTVVQFLKKQGVIVKDGYFPLLEEDVEYTIDSKNCISSAFLKVTTELGDKMIAKIDKREVRTQQKICRATGYKVLNRKGDTVSMTADTIINLE